MEGFRNLLERSHVLLRVDPEPSTVAARHDAPLAVPAPKRTRVAAYQAAGGGCAEFDVVQYLALIIWV